MTTWIIPCNAGFYDICGSFLHFKRINWRQSRSICQGDTIYIYVGVPIKAILYKCIATKVNLEEKEIDDRKFIKKDATCILRRTAAVGAVVQRPLCGLSSGRN